MPRGEGSGETPRRREELKKSEFEKRRHSAGSARFLGRSPGSREPGPVCLRVPASRRLIFMPLKVVLQGELHGARAAAAGDLAEGGRHLQAGARAAPLGVVPGIVQFPAE